MASTKYKLGELIEQLDDRNIDGEYGLNDVRGISIQKIFIDTKANMTGVPLKPYKLVSPGDFAYVTVTSRNGEKITLAHNTTDSTYIVSTSYVVFRVKKIDVLLPEYLYIYFNRPEFDRYARFNSWGSARETFAWEDMCDIEIDLPPIEIQKKYVDIYNAMIANQACYEHGLEDLKITCDAYIENLRREIGAKQIAQHIHEKSNKVSDSNKQYRSKDIAGISSVEKRFMETKADTGGVSLGSYKIVEPNDFSFNPNTARMGDRIPIALNDTDKDLLVSAIYPVFSVDESLEPEYLMMWFKRSEFDGYARFNSWGSARETFDFPDMKEVEIPIPSKDIQRAIVDIYESYTARKDICDHLKTQIRSICPILIKGSLEEANK